MSKRVCHFSQFFLNIKKGGQIFIAKICVNLQAFQTYWNILDALMEKAYKVYNPLILFLHEILSRIVCQLCHFQY